MSDDLHNIDDLFKKALEEHTELPSPEVWNNIDKSLDQKKVVSISKKYNKLKWAAAVLLLFSFGMAMYAIHIRIRNKELVKQNDASKILKNQKPQSNINPEDSTDLSKKNNAEIEKPKTITEQNKQEINNDTSIINDSKNDLSRDKNIADKARQKNELMRDSTQTKLLSEEKTDENITQQNKKQLLLKRKSAIKMQIESPAIDSNNNETKNSVESVVLNNDKSVSLNKEQPGKLKENIASPKEKYVAGIPVIAELKQIVQILVIKPFSQFSKAITNNSVPLKDNKTVPLKPRKIKNENGSLLSATIFFSPDFVSTNIKDDHPRFREDDRDRIEKEERNKFSSTIGLLIDFNAGKNWKIESGLTFSTRVTNIEPKTIYARPDNNGNINYRFNCSAGYSFVTVKSPYSPASGDSIRALTSKNTLQYIGVPLVVKHMFTKGRFSLTPGVGISANFLSKGKITTTIAATTGNENASINNIQGLKSMYFSGSASVGAEYQLDRKLAITFIPTARFALSSINKDAPVKTNLNSIGLAGGIIVKF